MLPSKENHDRKIGLLYVYRCVFFLKYWYTDESNREQLTVLWHRSNCAESAVGVVKVTITGTIRVTISFKDNFRIGDLELALHHKRELS